MNLVNPILERELRAKFRGKRSFLLLTLFVLLEIGIFVVVFLGAAFGDPGYGYTAGQSLGRRVFDVFAGVLVGLVGLFTPASGASVIAVEREKRTLEFLELTLLTPREIVVGKLAVALMYVGVLGVTALPVVSLVFVLGGVSPQHVFALYGVLATLALGLGSLGVWVSAWSKSTVTATVTAYALAMLLAPLFGAFLDGPLQHGGASWAKLLSPEVRWYGTMARPLVLLAVAVALVSNMLVQNAAAKMGNPETYRPASERFSLWLAFVGLLTICAGLMEGARRPVMGKGLPIFLTTEGFFLMVALAATCLAHQPGWERAGGPAAAIGRVLDPRSVARARVLGEPWFMALLCLSGAAVHLFSASAADRASSGSMFEWLAFHGLMLGITLSLSMVMTAAVAVWERWMPDLPRGFRVAFAGALMWSLFAAEYLHYSVMRKNRDGEELSVPATMLVHLSPFKALASLDISLATKQRPHREYPGYEWSELANFPGKQHPGWVGALVLYGGLGVMGAAVLCLAHRRRGRVAA